MSGKLFHTVPPSTKAVSLGSAARGAAPAVVIGASLLGASLFGAAQAQAGFTTVGKSKTASEATHEQILEDHFSGVDFEKVGNDYTGGAVSVTRIDDDADQSFTGSFTAAEAVAAFAKKKQSFGYFEGDSFTELFDVSGKNFNATGGASLTGLPSSIVFGRDGGKPVFSSDPAGNADGKDHLVTYAVSGGGVAQGTFLLFWEDASGSNADFDFNDLVVEIRGGQTLLIPLPAAAWSGLSVLGGLGLLSGARRMRRRLVPVSA